MLTQDYLIIIIIGHSIPFHSIPFHSIYLLLLLLLLFVIVIVIIIIICGGAWVGTEDDIQKR